MIFFNIHDVSKKIFMQMKVYVKHISLYFLARFCEKRKSEKVLFVLIRMFK